MGQKKEMAEGFKQATAKALAAVHEPDLFSSAQIDAEQTYECIRLPEDSDVAVGQSVRLVDMRDRIDVYRGVTCIGIVTAADTTLLRERYRLAGHPHRSVSSTVVDVSCLSAAFYVAIA